MKSPFTIESDPRIANESDEWEGALGTESVFEIEDDPELSFEEEFEIEDNTARPAGREAIPRVQLLSGHRATGPSLILSWNDIPAGLRTVDVVVHLHGYALCPADRANPWPRITSAGLDWRDPKGSDRSLGRVRPTLGILPRGHLFGGKTGAGYSFPALTTKTGLRQLIDLGLARLALRLGVASLAQGRLILTAHSGGGAALLGILRFNDPEEIHVFDGLYQDSEMLIRWAKSRITRDQKALAAGTQAAESYMANNGGALRVLYRAGTATERFSRPVNQALATIIPAHSKLRAWYRVERTCIGHCFIPAMCGWRLLAEASAELPTGCTKPPQKSRVGPKSVREVGEHTEESGDAAAEEASFDFSVFPEAVLKAARSGLETVAIKLAVAFGRRDENQLTNLIFFGRHPSRGGQPLNKNEPGFPQLVQEWLGVRDRLVRPALRQPSLPPAQPTRPADPTPTPSSGSCRFGFTPRAVESPGGGRITKKTPPDQVVNVRGVSRPIPLHPLAAQAWEALVAAARAAGHQHPLLLPTSGFRDPQQQRRLWEQALAKYGSASEARKWVAPPGGSAHQSGRAIDFHLGGKNNSGNVANLRRLPAYQWLAQNAVCFGFYPYEAEPWHWEYNPPASRGGGFTPELGTSEWEGETTEVDFPKEACGCRNCRETAEHEDSRKDIGMAIQELEADFEWEDEGGWASQYAPDVRQAIDLGGAMWPLALQRAIKSGIRDPGALANIAFYMQFPGRSGRPISAGEPGAAELIAAWKFFRDSARNMLPAPPPAPAASCGKTIPQVNILMPETAPGLEAKKPASHRYGLPETIAALKEIGRRWQAAHPSDPPVRIRDISRCGGGKFPPHDSHRMGIDVDIGLMRNDGLSAAVNFKTQPSKYSRPLTQEMVNTIRDNGLLKVHRLWFSDRGVTNVDHDNIHNNHVHVRFCLPPGYDLAAMKRAAFPGGTKGTFATCT